jgi:Tfp pilus assembly protein PilP
MKKLILIVFILFVGCAPSKADTYLAQTETIAAAKLTQAARPTSTPSPSLTPGPKVYVVTKSTGLYTAPNVNAKYTEELSEGTKLIPADGEESLTCMSFEDSGMKFMLCYMEVMKNGNTGWVLKQWFK